MQNFKGIFVWINGVKSVRLSRRVRNLCSEFSSCCQLSLVTRYIFVLLRQIQIRLTHKSMFETARCPAAGRIFKILRVRQSDNFSISGLCTRNSRFIQCYHGLHREEVVDLIQSLICCVDFSYRSALYASSGLEIICVFAVTAEQHFSAFSKHSMSRSLIIS